MGQPGCGDARRLRRGADQITAQLRGVAELARGELRALKGDDMLNAADIAFGHVEVVVARLVRDQVLRVHGAAEPLEVVIQSGQRLQILEARAVANRRERERVELVVRRDRIAGELDAYVAQLTAVVVVIRATAVNDGRILRARARAFELRVGATVDGGVADDHEAAPVTGHALPFRL